LKRACYFGTGSDCPSLVDPYTDEVRKYTYEDVYNAARVSDALPHIDFHMSLGLTSGVPVLTYDRHQFLAMMQGTSKPLVITAVDKEGLADQYRMACEVLGGPEEFAKAPLFVVYIEPSSPLSNSVEAVEKILYAAETGIPAIYTPCTICGATAPVTLAGGMVQCLAECLVGVVLGCQAVLPVLRGQKSGHIINVASIAGLAGAPEINAYGTAKAGVVAMSEMLRAEVKSDGIEVSALCPAFVKTRLTETMRASEDHFEHRVKRWMERSGVSASDVAEVVYRAVERPKFLLLTHPQTKWLLRLKRWAPELYFKLMLRGLAKAKKKSVAKAAAQSNID